MDGTVSVAGGRLRGVWRRDLWSFSGIPYGRAPTGALRWLPPQPPEPWADIRDASGFGPIAPQPASLPGLTSTADPGASEPQDEDCLSLNVWTPDLPEEPVPSGAGRPVMVWVHGGGFTSGSGSVFLYRGGNLVRNGDAVVVTINYRLGALGFLGLPGPDGLMGNWGLHDQVEALRWVRDNIAVFGGDPENVTVFGESAGAISIVALLAAPSASGLFRRAIVQSGGAHVHNREEAARSVSRLTDVLGLPSGDRDALIGVPASDLVAAGTELGSRRPEPGLLPLPFVPVVDGSFLPRHPLEAVSSGAASSLDLIVGTNRDELTLFALGNPALSALDEKGVHAWLTNSLPGVPAAQVVSSYRAAREDRGEPTTPNDIWVAAGSDIVFRWPSLQLAAAHGGRSFVYLFEWASPALGGVLGSCHALDLPFVFGAVHIPAVQMLTGSGPEVALLSEQMQGAWLSFARGGNPSHEGVGEWLEWEPQGRSTMVFGARTAAVSRPRNAELEVLERFRPLPPPAGQAS
jgi:para-nitrobenzyl esterase